MRHALVEQIDPLFADAFPFDGKRCERMADAVVERLKRST
jgi:hypothetical protein